MRVIYNCNHPGGMSAFAALAELPLPSAGAIVCQGDARADHLRTARHRLERTALEITEATAALRRTARRYVLGDMIEDMLEDLKGMLESLDPKWFRNAGELVRWETAAAKEIARFDDDEDLRDLPPPPHLGRATHPLRRPHRPRGSHRTPHPRGSRGC